LEYSFDKPGLYCICVLGNIEDSYSEILAGMAITKGIDDRGTVTTLEGILRDQAELSGVLNALYDMQYTLLSVNDCGDCGQDSVKSNALKIQQQNRL
jgi:hypothetical protein